MTGAGLVRRSPAFARLLVAQAISPLGDAMATTALILHVQRTTGTATSVAVLLFVQAIPPLASPLAGAIADRVRPGRLLAAGFLAQGVLVTGLAVTLGSLGPLLVVVFLLALVETPLGAAVGRAVPTTVPDADLPAANALREGARELGSVIGPPLAGLLFALTDSGRLVLAIDALTFLIAIPLVLGLPTPVNDETAERTTVRRDIREGVSFVWRTPSVRAMAIGFWVVVFFSAPDDLILAFLGAITFGAGPVGIGFLLAAASAGLVLGLPLVRRAGRRLGLGAAVVTGFAVMSIGNLLTAAAPWLAAAFAAQVIRGAAIPLADSSVTTHLQRTVPPRLLGRVLANVYGGVGVAAASGYLLGGPVLDATNPRIAFVVVGVGGLVGTAVTAVLLRRARA